ncbi:hypothetical protein [Devosia limi]|uniref:Uncharacterized protein n=1 Tax=Devosia limi DSM 17137 TaxID=1121477 RepID=A0A1M5CH92_9HYPH|nr:hypothetical protein [Devosia limi]SHF54133.1 hypothetical protein SAMN02745223_02917 [Devosia limi DSM 17137]
MSSTIAPEVLGGPRFWGSLSEMVRGSTTLLLGRPLEDMATDFLDLGDK